MMNQRKTSKAGMLKYLLIAPLALALVVSSNAETLISSVKKVIIDEAETEKSKAVSKSTVMDEMVVVGYADTTSGKIKEVPLPPPPPPPSKDDELVPPPPPIPPLPSAPNKDGELVPPPPPPVPNDVVFQVVEIMPVFPGGESEMMRYLSQNVRYPIEAQKNGVQGRVICRFVIKTDGTISDVKVVRNIDPNLDAEAVRVIKAMPNWTPGEQRGVKVNVQYTLPINFKLEGETKTNPWGDKPIVILDGQAMSPNFNTEIIKPESIDKIEVLKPDTDKKELISRFGKWAGNGVIKITTKKK